MGFGGGREPERAPATNETTALYQPVRIATSDTAFLYVEAEGRFAINPLIDRFVFMATGGPADCPDSDGEAIFVGQAVIRDEAGNLIAARGNSPIREGGVAEMSSGLPEVSLAWVDVGCSRCVDHYAVRAVALQLTWGGATATILPGERATFVLGERRYSFRVSSAYSASRAGACGLGFWALVREDFLLPLPAVRDK